MFDPYHKWLGIPKNQRPPTFYQLLSIAPDEDDTEVIEEAAIRQTTHLRTYQIGEHAADCTRLLNEIALARQTLLNPAKRKAYDATLARAAAAKAPRPEEGVRARSERLTADAPRQTAAENALFAGLDEEDGAVRVPVRRPGRNTRLDKSGGRGIPVVLIASIGGGAVALVLVAVVAVFALRGRSSAPAEDLAKGPNPPPLQPKQPVQQLPQGVQPGPVPQQLNPVVEPPPPDPNPNPAPGVVPTYKARRSWNAGTLIASLALTPDGRQVVVGGSQAVLWDLQEGRVVKRFGAAFPAQQIRGSVSVSPDGKVVAAALGGAKGVHLWDTASGMELVHLTRDHLSVVNSIAYADAQHLLSCGDDRAVQFWDTRTKNIIIQFGGPQEPVVAVAASRDGRRAASVTRSGLVYFWDLVKRMPQHLSLERLDDALSIALSADGSLAAVGYGAGIQLFKDGKATGKLNGHGSFVKAVAFTPDGRHLLSGGGDNTMRLWELDTQKEIARFVGEKSPLIAVACTPDGLNAVSGCADGTVSTWRLPKQLVAAAGPPPQQVVGNPEPWPGPELLPPDRLPLPPDPQPTSSPLPLRSQESAPEVAVKASKPHRTWGINKPTCALAVLPDGRHALVGSNEINLYDLERGVPLGRRLGMPLVSGNLVGNVAISPDGKRAATALWRENVVRLWNLATATEYGQLTGHAGAVNCVAFVDNKRVLSGGDDRTVRLWDTTKKKQNQLHVFEGHSSRVNCLAVSKDGSQAASGDIVGGVRFWDLNEREAVGNVTGLAHVDSIAISPDGMHIAVAHPFGITLLKDRRQAGKLSGHKGRVSAVAFTSDGRLVSGGEDKTVRLWEIDTRREVARFEGHTHMILALGVTPNGKLAISGAQDGLLLVWKLPKVVAPKDGRNKEQVAKTASPPGRPVPRLLTGHTTPVTSVAFSPSGKRLLSGGAKALRYWDAGKGTALLAMPSPSPINCVGFSRDGKQAFSGGADGRVWLWDLQDGRRLSSSLRPQSIGSVVAATFLHGQNTIMLVESRGWQQIWEAHAKQMGGKQLGKEMRAAAFAPRAQLMAILAVDGGVELWQIGTRNQKWGALPGSTQALSVALSEDGTTVVTGGSDGLVRLWDRAQQRELRSFAGHDGKVNAVAVSPDGRRALSGGEDKTVRLWDLETGKELQRLTGHTGSVLSVGFSPDGSLVASGSADNTVRIGPLIPSGKE